MGLEMVELTFCIEDEFNIDFNEADLEKVTTVGATVDLIYDMLQPQPGDFCLSQQGFYKVRKLLMKEFGVDRDAVKPGTRLDEIITAENRIQDVKYLIKSINGGNCSGFDLERSLPTRRWMTGVNFLFFVLTWLIYGQFVTACLSAIVGWILLLFLTRKLKIHFPENYQYVKDLIFLIPHEKNEITSKEDIFLRLKPLIIETLCTPALVTLESRYIEDLHAG